MIDVDGLLTAMWWYAVINAWSTFWLWWVTSPTEQEWETFDA